MAPKFTVKMSVQNSSCVPEDLKQAKVQGSEVETVIFDSDYNNMKRLQDELTDALKALNGRYPKKVFKFIK